MSQSRLVVDSNSSDDNNNNCKSPSRPISLGRDLTLRNRHITALQVGMLGFFSVAGGPIGIEPAVAAGGPLLTLIAMIVVPLFWAMPQAWLTAEMSTIFDENGGSILWVQTAFGPFCGWLNAFNSVFSNFFDLAVYPVLCVENLQVLIDVSPSEKIVLIIAISVLIFLLNVHSLQVVGWASALLCVAVLLPYMVQAVLSVPSLDYAKIVERKADVHWSLFMNTLLWNYTGWDNLGDLAGEVKEPQRNYPLGIVLAVFLTMMNYLVPVCVAVGMSNGDWSLWKEGYFVTIAAQYSPWLGHWMLLSALFSVFGNFNVMNASAARSIYRMSRVKMFPASFSQEWERHQSPIAALLIQLVFTIVLAITIGDFGALVEMDNFLTVISLIFETASFLAIKLRYSDIHPAFEAPGGIVGAFFIVLPKCIFLLALLLLASSTTWMFCSLFNLLLVMVYPCWSRKYEREYLHNLELMQSPIEPVNNNDLPDLSSNEDSV